MSDPEYVADAVTVLDVCGVMVILPVIVLVSVSDARGVVDGDNVSLAVLLSLLEYVVDGLLVRVPEPVTETESEADTEADVLTDGVTAAVVDCDADEDNETLAL